MISDLSAHSNRLLQKKLSVDGLDLLKRFPLDSFSYNAYPSEIRFNHQFTENDFLNCLQLGLAQEEPISLLLQLPIAQVRSLSVNNLLYDRSIVRRYLDHLHKEMAILRLQTKHYQRPVKKLRLVGTPTIFNRKELGELLEKVNKYFNLCADDDRDFAVELDPVCTHSSDIVLLSQLGFNHVTLVISEIEGDTQSIATSEGILKLKQLVEDCRRNNFKTIEFDLIYGLPLQTEEILADTLDRIIAMDADRISCVHLSRRCNVIDQKLIALSENNYTEDQTFQFFSVVLSRLNQSAYKYIGMGCFAKRNDPLSVAKREGNLYRDLLGYTTGKIQDVVGLGPAAISSFDGVCVRNTLELDAYCEMLDQNKLPVEQGVALNDDDVIRREVIQQLTCYQKVDIDQIEKFYGIDFFQHFAESVSRLKPLIDAGFIKIAPTYIRLHLEGSPFLSHVCMAFDES